MRKLTFLMILCLYSSFTTAETLSYTLSGGITRILQLGGDGDTGIGAVFSNGDTYTAELTYDTDAPLSTSNATDGFYNGAGSITITYNNGNTYSISNARVNIKNNGVIGPNNLPWDSFGLSDSSVTGPDIGDARPVAVNVSLSDTIDGSPFTSIDLVPLPDLSEFNVTKVETVFRDDAGTTAYVFANVTNLEPATPVDQDADNDGVLDADDQCPLTPEDQAVNPEGCSGAQYIALTCDHLSCENNPEGNHGEYVTCVTHAAQDAVDMGLISPSEKARFIREAAQDQCN